MSTRSMFTTFVIWVVFEGYEQIQFTCKTPCGSRAELKEKSDVVELE